jgi:FkbM family methyltransferase
MHEYGLVSIGSHTGFWLQTELKRFKDKKNILIEPVPYNLIELKENTKKFDNIIIEESAISDKDEQIPFYFIKRDSIEKLKKHWASGIGSFDKLHILNHRSKRFLVSESDIETTNINCLSFASLVKKYSINKIEKLMLDVEGSEYKILKSINLKNLVIKEIFFEKKHFDGHFKEGQKLNEIKDKFLSNNYKLVEMDNENMLAKLKNF